MKINVFGTEMLVVRSHDQWRAYYVGNEGKRRDVPDLAIPAHLIQAQLLTYLADVYHENATPQHNEVSLIGHD